VPRWRIDTGGAREAFVERDEGCVDEFRERDIALAAITARPGRWRMIPDFHRYLHLRRAFLFSCYEFEGGRAGGDEFAGDVESTESLEQATRFGGSAFVCFLAEPDFDLTVAVWAAAFGG
jgi:hypothetical protein